MTAATLDEMPDVMRADQVAAVLGVGKNLVYEQARDGNIPGAFRVGRALRFSKARLAEWLGPVPAPAPVEGPA